MNWYMGECVAYCDPDPEVPWKEIPPVSHMRMCRAQGCLAHGLGFVDEDVCELGSLFHDSLAGRSYSAGLSGN